MTDLCAKGEALSDYAAKRYQDYHATRHNPRAHVRAHYKRRKDEAYEEMISHINRCDECRQAQEVA